jgi:alkanesulfonate monooxygenase SsuD/methylene tetrahydromethanopterin reductase-like flavin-dependent oxidoreductase (luciferase family)
MLLSWFTEQPMSDYPEEEALRPHPDDHPARRPGDSVLLFSNKYFDPVAGSRLYGERIKENVYAEQMGFDAVMVNEHHNGAFCMNARCNISTAAIVTATERVKVLQMGNPLPLWANPVQLAEELAMLDMMSNGRLVTGIVRGGGQEQLANNVNPAYNREMFDEAHNLLIKIWTEPGPFSWEGEHYQFRVVNPWALPLQKPHPRIFVPGVVSKETVVWAAEHGYPYVALGTTIPQTKQIWSLYDQTALAAGYTAGSEHRGYLLRCHVNSDHDTAIRNAREFSWMRGEFTGMGNPIWSAPAGYSSWESRKARLKHVGTTNDPVEDQIARGTIIAGAPDEVIPQLRNVLRELRTGTLVLWGADGHVGHDDTLECIRLLGQEVLPALRECGDELGLQSPFEADSPVGVGRGPVRLAQPFAG